MTNLNPETNASSSTSVTQHTGTSAQDPLTESKGTTPAPASTRESSQRIFISYKNSPPKRRVTLPINEKLADALEKVADRYDTSLVDIMRRFLRMGLYVLEEQEKSGARLILRNKDEDEKEVVFLL